jgi:hypothetical protein
MELTFHRKNKNAKNTIIVLCCIAIIIFTGCDLLKTEDQKISDALVGKIYIDDYEDKDGTKTKDISGEFYRDGKFWQEATVELVDEESFESTDITMKIQGEWNVKDKFIYYTYDYSSLKLTPQIYMLMKEELVETLKKKNTPDKVIDYDPSKVIIENSNGERHAMKKSY